MGQPRSVSNTSPITVTGLTAATCVKVGGGWVHSAAVTLTGPCNLNDAATAAGAATANLIAVLPTGTNVYQISMKFNNGLVVTPTGSASVTFE